MTTEIDLSTLEITLVRNIFQSRATALSETTFQDLPDGTYHFNFLGVSEVDNIYSAVRRNDFPEVWTECPRENSVKIFAQEYKERK